MSAVLLSSTPVWVTLSTSAWNPFLMPILMALILNILYFNTQKDWSKQQFFLIGFFASLSFHFSSAYAFFYLINLPLIFIYRYFQDRQKVSLSVFISGVIGFILPFLPQIVFELRHNFVQSRAIFAFLTTTNEAVASPSLLDIFIAVFNEAKIAIIPEFRGLDGFNLIILLLIVFFIGVGAFLWAKQRSLNPKNAKRLFIFETLVFVVIPVLGFSKLHFNIWYFYSGLIPILFLVAKFLDQLPRQAKCFLVVLYFASVANNIYYFYQVELPVHSKAHEFLPVKQEILDYIYAQADDLSFSSYHYLPDIYDYSYQYLYLVRAKNGYQLPVDFSYKPDEVAYFSKKPLLIDQILADKDSSTDSKNQQHNSQQINDKNPELIFYIVSYDDQSDLLKEWWGQQNFAKIIKKKQFSDQTTVYTALTRVED